MQELTASHNSEINELRRHFARFRFAQEGNCNNNHLFHPYCYSKLYHITIFAIYCAVLVYSIELSFVYIILLVIKSTVAVIGTLEAQIDDLRSVGSVGSVGDYDSSFLGSVNTFSQFSIGAHGPGGGNSNSRLNTSDESLFAAEERVRALEYQIRLKSKQFEAVMR